MWVVLSGSLSLIVLSCISSILNSNVMSIQGRYRYTPIWELEM